MKIVTFRIKFSITVGDILQTIALMFLSGLICFIVQDAGDDKTAEALAFFLIGFWFNHILNVFSLITKAKLVDDEDIDS